MTALRGQFDRSFQSFARRVRGYLAARRVLAGLTLGFLAAALAAFVLWWLREGALRPWSALLGLLGALAGLTVALRYRWSDTDVALYLDARLGAHEAIATAVELRREAERADPAREIVVVDAARALSTATPAAVRPRVLRLWHSLAPLAALGVVGLSLAPLPPAPPEPPAPPGAERVKLNDLAGLDRIEALAKLAGREPSDRERLKDIAERAAKLREQLRKGIEKREAQAEVARLRDDIALLSRSFGDEKNRNGLEAAIRQLEKSEALRNAARALGDGDLTAFDREMQALANRVESEHREEAKRALQEAIRAARERGAESVARALQEQERLWNERSSRAEALRELADALRGKLSDEALEDLREFGESGSPEAQQKLAEALADALDGLSDEERKKLAENLQKNLQQGGEAGSMSKKQLEELAKRLATPEGQKELEQMLRELARQTPSSEAERQQSLDDADRGGAEAQRGLGVVPVPMQGGESGGRGGRKDIGQGNHDGKTDASKGGDLRAKAKTRLDPRGAWHGTTLGRAPARAGETANQAGSGALGKAGPTEVGGVERSDVPEEYREQVGRYFQP